MTRAPARFRPAEARWVSPWRCVGRDVWNRARAPPFRMTPTPDERRRGSLPLLCVVGLVWLLCAHPEVGEWLIWDAGEALMYAVSLPALYGAAYFAMQYLTTLWLRPNTWRIHWMMAAVGYGPVSYTHLTLPTTPYV